MDLYTFAEILRRSLFEWPLRLLDLVDELLILLERDRIRRQDRLISVSLQRVALRRSFSFVSNESVTEAVTTTG